MAWIESHQELGRHPKTKKLARLAGISLPTAIGHLHLLWWWAMDYAESGNLSPFTAEDIADAILWEGDAQAILDALITSGFIDRTESGCSIHDWDDYIGLLLEKREDNRERTKERVKRYRERQKAKKEARNGDVTRYKRVSNADVTALPYPTVPNPTVPNPTQPIEPNGSCPASRTANAPTTALTAQEKPCLSEADRARNETINEIVAFLNATLGAHYRPSSTATRTKVTARLNEGFTLDDFKTVILKKSAEWGGNPEMNKYLRPETLFGTKFEGYLNQPDARPQTARGVLERLYHEA